MRARSLAAASLVAVATAATAAAAGWQASQQLTQGTIQTGQIAAPSSLQISTLTCNKRSDYTLQFTWTAPNPTTGINGYEIYSSSTSGGPYTTLVTTATGANTLQANGPTMTTGWGTTTYYVVRATTNSNWTSAYSTETTFTTPNYNSCK